MKLILLGAPGSGKGTVARELENKLGTPVLTTSSILKDETKSGSAAGKTMKEFMDAGKLVPDELVIQAVMTKLSKFDGYILDGFPRTLNQAKVFEAELGQTGVKIDKVIYLDLPLEVAKQRNLLRLTCKVCGFSPIPGATVCPKCGGELVKRVDDDEATILKRLSTYIDETAPLVDFYATKGKLLKIDANAFVDVVRERVFTALGIA